VLGLEVVLADGRILSDLSKLRKNNTGFDLTHLVVGSEGTLGVITAAVLKLFPIPGAIEAAFIGLASPRAALELLDLSRELANSEITSFELLPRIGLDFVLAHFDAREVLRGKYPWYVLLELSSQRADGLSERLLELLEAASKKHIVEDAAVASSLEQRASFWKLRELLPEAQRHEGGSIKHDVSVPIASIPAFLEEVESAVASALPGARLVAFGHAGDGNIHCNVSQPVGADKNAFLARWDEVNAVIHGLVMAHCGSISAEHGIGQMKRDLLPKVKDKTAMEVMRVIKKALDPKGILNPGKVL
jgi:FAD/FMN-containing dehydrogenase